MRGNTGQQIAGLEYLNTTWTSRQDMEAFDKLPRRIRDLVNASPERYSAADIAGFMASKGENYTLHCMLELNRKVMQRARAERGEQWTR